MAGPVTDAVLVNLLLDGKLEQMLRDWRTKSWPPVPYEVCAERINVLIEQKAIMLDAPTRVFKWSAIRRWVLDVYCIEWEPTA